MFLQQLFQLNLYNFVATTDKDDVKQILCYLIKNNNNICFDKFEPFATEAVYRALSEKKNDNNKINILNLNVFDGSNVNYIFRTIELITGKKV